MATVKVKCPITEDNDQGFFIIEEADLAPEHKLFDAPEESAAPKAEPKKSKSKE